MDNTKLFNGIKDVIIDWLVPHTKHVALLGGRWVGDSRAGAFCWYCSDYSSFAGADIGAYLCDNGEIGIWTGNKENINLRIYYDTAISKPIVSHNTDSEHEDFSEDDIRNLYIKIKEYLGENKELVMLSNEETPEKDNKVSLTNLDRYVKTTKVFDPSKLKIGAPYKIQVVQSDEYVYAILEKAESEKLTFKWFYVKEQRWDEWNVKPDDLLVITPLFEEENK